MVWKKTSGCVSCESDSGCWPSIDIGNGSDIFQRKDEFGNGILDKRAHYNRTTFEEQHIPMLSKSIILRNLIRGLFCISYTCFVDPMDRHRSLCVRPITKPPLRMLPEEWRVTSNQPYDLLLPKLRQSLLAVHEVEKQV
jgi:hypothetical protein